MILITGGSASGKSEYAERRAVQLPGPRVYLAAMEVYGEEGEARVRKHRAMREGKGFRTVEQTRDLAQVFARGAVTEEDLVLLEDLSNLAANEMFLPDGWVRGEQETEELLVREVLSLSARCRELIVVGNLLGGDGAFPGNPAAEGNLVAEENPAAEGYTTAEEDPPSEEDFSLRYLRAFSRAQNRIAAEASEVWIVRSGCPVILKG